MENVTLIDKGNANARLARTSRRPKRRRADLVGLVIARDPRGSGRGNQKFTLSQNAADIENAIFCFNGTGRPPGYSRRRFLVQTVSPTTREPTHVWNLKELTMNKLFVRFLKDESGATAIEYGLIAAGISVAIIATVQGLGTKLNATFTSVSNAL